MGFCQKATILILQQQEHILPVSGYRMGLPSSDKPFGLLGWHGQIELDQLIPAVQHGYWDLIFLQGRLPANQDLNSFSYFKKMHNFCPLEYFLLQASIF